MQRPSAVTKQLLTTNLWVLLIASFFAFFLNGVIWATLFEYYFSGFGGNLISFAGASLSLIVGSVYSTFLGKMMRDYLAGPTSYLKLLVQIGNAGDALAGLYHADVARGALTNIKSMLQHLGFYSFRIFAPENADELGLVEDRPRVSLVGAGREALAERAAAHPVTYAVTNIPDDLSAIVSEARWGDPIRLAHDLRAYLYREIAIMSRSGIDMEIMHMALRSLKPVWNQLEAIESGRLVREPAIFDAHMRALFVFYFFIWVPISSWASVGWIATAVSYPFVAMAFLGIGVYNAWIGDPFDPMRPVLVADLVGAREAYAVTEMERKFATTMSQAHRDDQNLE